MSDKCPMYETTHSPYPCETMEQRIADLEQQLAKAQEVITVYETNGYEGLMMMVKGFDDVTRQLAEARQENAALRAEVERRKLKWKPGPLIVSRDASYWIDTGSQKYAAHFYAPSKFWFERYAGPILPPTEE
jgi:hypothetical protein